MPSLAGHLDRDAVSRGHHGPGIHAHHAGPHLRPVVHAVDRLHRKPVEQAILDHGLGTGKTFLTRLEDQHRGAVELARLSKIARRAHQHRRVPVVAAAVHHAGTGGLPGKVVVFGHGQRVHVGAQARHAAAAALAPMDHRHHAGLADAGVDVIDAAHPESLHDALGGVVFLEAQLRVSVQIVAQGREIGMKRRDVRERASMSLDTGDRHQWPPAFSTRKRGSTAKYSRSTTRLMTTKISAIRHR